MLTDKEIINWQDKIELLLSTSGADNQDRGYILVGLFFDYLAMEYGFHNAREILKDFVKKYLSEVAPVTIESLTAIKKLTNKKD